MKKGTFTNSAGQVFKVSGIPPLLFDKMRLAQEKEWCDKGLKLPTIPTYITDANEVVDWDHKSVMKDGTPEEKLEWSKYEEEVQDFETEFNLRRMNVCFMHIEEDPMKDAKWIKTMEYAHIPLPEDEHELKQLYGETCVLAGTGPAGDLMRLILTLQVESGYLDREVVDAFKNSFRNKV